MKIEAYDSIPTLMLYSFNMPLFFFISGYLAYREEIGKFDELKKIGSKFVFLVIPAIAFYSFSMFQQHGNGIFDFISDGLGKYWFTFTLFEIFLIYYIASGVSKSKYMLAVILVILSVTGVGYLSFFSEYEIPIFDFNHLAKYFQFFTLGVYSRMFAVQYDKLMRNEYLKTFGIVSFFVVLFSLFKIEMPSVAFHLLRDIVLRYLGLYIVISLFYCKQNTFNEETGLNKLILKIGQNSLAIYLLQYFFMPNFSAFPMWLKGLDWLSIYAISFVYAVIITAVCMVFIELFYNSLFVKKYFLGQK